MKKHIIPILLLAVYGAVLIKVMVFKDLPTIRIGQLMLNFSGTDTGHGPNFVPFATIAPYLLGHKGLIIAGINLVGNIVLFVPLGFLLPFFYKNMTWKKSLVVAVAAGLSIEVMQVILRVGIFDIDDVILNALGVMIGYCAFVLLSRWIHSRNYKNIFIAAIVVIVAAFAAFYVVYPWGQPVQNTPVGAGDVQFDRSGTEQEGGTSQSGDLCGGTGGNGQIVSVENNSFTIKQKDGLTLIVNLTAEAAIKTSAGSASVSDLKMGDRVTLVGDAHRDGTFTAEAVFVCNAPD